MRGDEGRFGALLHAVEGSAPTAAVQVFADHLGERFGAEQVSFLIADFAGRSLVRLTQSGAQGPRGQEDQRGGHDGEDPELVRLDDETLPHGRVVVEQQVQLVPLGGDAAGPTRVLAPVSARGDAIGVLELVLPARPDEGTVGLLAEAAHELAYVVTTERRHTDLYEWGQRSRPVSLAAEIQRRLLPDSFTCEAGQFTLAGWLEPASTVGGDTFDYALDAERLYVSMTDAMGHDVDAALLASLAVGSLRNSRRAGGDLASMAATAGAAIDEHRGGLGFVTGLLLSVELSTGQVQVVNAGHPAPLLARGGRVQPVELTPDLPLGVLPDATYRVQRFQLDPGDRLVLLTDGMLEHGAREVDLPGLIAAHADAHPRQLMQVLTTAVQDATPELVDDATALCLHWHGTTGAPGERSRG
ncbi:PP2C family protein-serine/threonine phosphatase [Kineococcus sp. SYSU DK001]|uniref:PP2C family protein-serine/threonine phosphatase n=1 Tax=Kineococcus sp. SYSU DK001 TaxID=3383122 RepID=UPI003D7E7988